jgi:hypothetical protein
MLLIKLSSVNYITPCREHYYVLTIFCDGLHCVIFSVHPFRAPQDCLQSSVICVCLFARNLSLVIDDNILVPSNDFCNHIILVD